MSLADLLKNLLGALNPQQSQPSSEKPENPSPASDPVPIDDRFKPADQREADLLAQLYPPFAELVQCVLRDARKAGLCVYIFEGLRDMERQKALYAQGRDKNGVIIDPKKVVTKAKPGYSFHNYGLAVDLVFDGIPSTAKVDWSWSDKHPWKRLGQIGQAVGLEWAGSWKSFPEMPHFQFKMNGLTTAKLREWYAESQSLIPIWERINALWSIA